ncbi:MAG TPA: alpha/beta hydrolase [Chloroflexota bacterium]|nr:alpha/beta hydrolase [Chloroflexota bacterium]
MEVESHWLTVAGRAVHARVWPYPPQAGAPAVVCVHGLLVSSRYMVPTATRLARCHQVYVPDLPGFGRSAKPKRVLGMAELADALASWMEAGGIGRATLVGNSMGCQVMAQLAVRHPQRMERAVMVGPTIDPQGHTAAEQVRRLLTDMFLEPPASYPLLLRDLLDGGVRRTLLTFRAALRDRIEEHLPRVRVPTLVVRGARDPLVPQRWAEEATRLLPQGRLVVVPGVAHAVNFSAPDVLSALVRRFIRAPDAAPDHEA